ncbi:hypothetical protein FCIRC_3812 [Fusarium circinatum]|uniref:Uncharacterized protein n=1 Tax=Fusarium circinatum TaxID=48490 RepID=A0A8H5U691_FUSCI|nr:hypothetical protein FCIRC_3812 [Fusarium circinatum]
MFGATKGLVEWRASPLSDNNPAAPDFESTTPDALTDWFPPPPAPGYGDLVSNQREPADTYRWEDVAKVEVRNMCNPAGFIVQVKHNIAVPEAEELACE